MGHGAAEGGETEPEEGQEDVDGIWILGAHDARGPLWPMAKRRVDCVPADCQMGAIGRRYLIGV